MARSESEQAQLDALFHRDGAGTLVIAYDRDGTFVPPRSYLQLLELKIPENASENHFLYALRMHNDEAETYIFVPDLQIEEYCFPVMKDLPPIETLDIDQYIRQRLLPYIREKNIEPIDCVSLRDIVYAHRRDMGISSFLNQEQRQFANYQDYIDFLEKQEHLQNVYKNNPWPQLPFHAVQTSRGMLVFSNSELGQQGLKQFNQELADHYFSQSGETEPVLEYEITGTSGVLRELVDSSYQKGEDGKYGFWFKNARYAHNLIPNPASWKVVVNATMQPTSADFLYFVQKTGSRINSHNNNVWRLLELKEYGYNRRIIQEDPNFAEASEFKKIADTIEYYFTTGADQRTILFHHLEQVQRKANDLLCIAYDVRGHRSFWAMMEDPSYDPQIGDIRLSRQIRETLMKGHNFYFPEIIKTRPELHYITADFGNYKLRISETPFPGETFQEKEGKIVAYTPRLKTENSPKKVRTRKI